MLFDKLRQIEERSHEIARVLSDPAIFGQPAEYARLRKEHADSLEIVERFGEYREILRRISEARHILAEGGDRELAELAQAEIDELSARQTALEEELKRLKVSDLLLQTLYTVSSLGYSKLSAEDRDLDQARLAIESLRALLPVLESELGEEAVRDFKQVTANLQLAYADAANAGKDEAP